MLSYLLAIVSETLQAYRNLERVTAETADKLQDEWNAIHQSIGHRRRPSKHSRKYRGRVLRHLEKEWRLEKSFLYHLNTYQNYV